MNRVQSSIVLLLVLISAAASASTFEKGDRIHITSMHRIEDDFYGFAKNITVDGAIDGDLLCFGMEVSTGGKVGGSISAFSQTFSHSGTTRQSLRVFANTCRITGYVERSVLAFGSELSLEQSAVVGGDADFFGGTITIDGQVGKDLRVMGENIYISGAIDGDVDLSGKKITISAPAVIRGNLNYESTEEASIDESGVEILGETNWTVPDKKESDADSEGDLNIIVQISQLLAAFLFGLLMLYMFRRYATVSFERLQSEFAKSLAVGILTAFIMIFSFLVFLLALLGVAAGLVLSSGSTAVFGSLILIVSIILVPITSFLSISGGILMYCGGIMFSFVLGYVLLSLIGASKSPMAGLNLLIGLVIATLVCAIPYLGPLAFLVFVLTGAGAIVLGVRRCRAIAIENERSPAADESPGAVG